MKKIGIIICNRYHTCAGGKCLRALRNREGAFARYKDEEVVIGTHPIPQNYYLTHQCLGTWQSARALERIRHILTDEPTRLAYD